MEKRPPVCAVIGHIDAGKTSFLDCLRNTKSQEKEAGNITQRIGVTSFLQENLQQMTKYLKTSLSITGILFIDTPGHECFEYQRICGTGISDLVIVIVDINKGLQKQTIECLNLLRSQKTPFLIAANKVDTLCDWVNQTQEEYRTLKEALNHQAKHTQGFLNQRIDHIKLQLAENGFNSEVYYKNKNPKEYISIVPISVKSKDGIPDIIMLINMLADKFLKKTLVMKRNISTGYIVEKINDSKHGVLYTCILTDGILKQGQQIIAYSSSSTATCAKVQTIHIPNETVEVGDKLQFNAINEVHACRVVVIKTNCSDLLSGTRFYVFHNKKEKDMFMKLQENLVNQEELDYNKQGIYINAPSLGMVRALYNLCQQENIPVAGSHVGNVDKKELSKIGLVTKKTSDVDMNTYNQKYRMVMCFGITNNKQIYKIAKENQIYILEADIVYDLIKQYTKIVNDINQSIKDRHPNIIRPCRLQILKNYIFHRKNPIIIGVRVTNGKLAKSMNIGFLKGDKTVLLGAVTKIEKNTKDILEAATGEEVCIKVETFNTVEYGRNFDDENELVTYYNNEDIKITRQFPDIFDDVNFASAKLTERIN